MKPAGETSIYDRLLSTICRELYSARIDYRLSRWSELKIVLSIAWIVLALVGCKSSISETNISTSTSPSPALTPGNADQLSERLKKLSDAAGGKVSVAVMHIETGRQAQVDASNELPLFSVFKLPLAITVLKKVEEGSLKLEQNVHIRPDELVAGTRANSQRWQKPVDVMLKNLLELSIIDSDNTSSDKLLQLVGGPLAVTERMRSFDIEALNIHSTIKEYLAKRSSPNTGSALALVKLLSRLQRGELLKSAGTEFLIGIMERAKTGLHRIRGNLPAGTRVADKSGSGELNTQTNAASSTNDVGLITLPNGRGHLAIAVLLQDSTLADDQQEKLIADLARAAFDAYSADR